MIATIITITYINQNRLNQVESYLHKNIAALDTIYKSSLDKYEILVNHYFQTEIDNEDILKIFVQGANASGEERRLARGQLYKALYPIYKKLKLDNFHDLHFHLNNNESYLLFSKPDTYGDDLSSLRNIVKVANKEKKMVKYFEAGRLFSGFKDIFPLYYQNLHVGSVEFSLPLKKIIETISHKDPNGEYSFLLKSSLVTPKLFEKQKSLYTLSTINPAYVQENSPKTLSPIAKKINKKLRENINLHKAMKRGEPYASYVRLNNERYCVSFLPMRGIEKNIEGYLISYKKESVAPYSKIFVLVVILMLSGLVIFIVMILAINKKSKDLMYQKEWFESINDTLGEGLYVMDTDATIQYTNPMASKILGFSKEELLGANAHHLFHSHSINHNLTLEQCPIRKNVLEHGEFTSKEEHFTHKNGKIIPIEIISRPIIRDHFIVQIVTAFRDISDRRELESQMHLLTKALEASINAMVITDKNAIIEWANPAFEKMTGFTLKEILGQNPKDLINSGQQSSEFYVNMWDTILNKEAWTGELINKRKDGSIYHEEIHITPVLDKEGEIEHFVAVKQNINERKEKEERIEHFAFYDVLTNLPNRRLLGEHLGKILDTFPRQNKYVAILYLDLDKFKSLNDTKGHDIGDELLKQIAYRIDKLMRKEDIIARIGGDEFVIVLDDLPKDYDEAVQDTRIIAEKVRKTIYTPFDLKDETYQASTSIGICLFRDNFLSMEELLKHADTALYVAKLQGRNSVHFFNQ